LFFVERAANIDAAVASLAEISGEKQEARAAGPSKPDMYNFPRSAQDRMASFQERKERLIQNARQRYLEKKALQTTSS